MVDVDPWTLDDITMSIELDDPIPFGKYRGTPIKDLPTDYVSWLLNNGTSDWVVEYRDALTKALTHIDEDSMPTLTLAEDQRAASDVVCHQLFDAGEPIARIQGAAGYGKSYACQDIVIKAKRRGYQVSACATSYVATQNLAKDLDVLNVPCATIARTLKLTVEYQGMRELYVPSGATQYAMKDLLGEGKVLIVDEYSMVDDTIGNLLVNSAIRMGGKLLVVGDRFQLPSPAQNWDSVLTRVTPAVELTIPKRYETGSPLHLVEQTARSNPFDGDIVTRHLDDTSVRSTTSLEALYRSYVSSFEKAPDEQHLMLWYKRADMVAANEAIRARLFGTDVDAIQEGEQLRVQRTADYTSDYGEDGDRVYSGTTIKAIGVHKGTKTVDVYDLDLNFNIPCHYVDTDDGRRLAVIFSVTENAAQSGTLGADEFNDALKVIADRCETNNKWGPYRAFRNCFVQVAYEYASTVHRVQGQSVDHVFTCPQALLRADSYTAPKLLYVGMTRAKKSLTCL